MAPVFPCPQFKARLHPRQGGQIIPTTQPHIEGPEPGVLDEFGNEGALWKGPEMRPTVLAHGPHVREQVRVSRPIKRRLNPRRAPLPFVQPVQYISPVSRASTRSLPSLQNEGAELARISHAICLADRSGSIVLVAAVAVYGPFSTAVSFGSLRV